MSRSFSASAIAALYATETASFFPTLCKIDHAQFEAPWRIVNNSEPVDYDGYTYLPFPFTFDPPAQDEANSGTASITIDVIDESIVASIQALSSAPTLTLVAAFVQGGEAPEALIPWTFTLRGIAVNGTVMTGSLVLDDRFDNQMGPIEFSPHLFPGVF